MQIQLLQNKSIAGLNSPEQLIFVDSSDVFKSQLVELDEIRSREIGVYYPGTERNYLLRTISGFNSSKESTLQKSMLISFREERIVGYVVLTKKTLNRVKLGPAWVSEDFRRRGICLSMILSVIKSKSAEHFYFTVPEDNLAMIATAEACRFRYDACIPNLYRNGKVELVYSRGVNKSTCNNFSYEDDVSMLKLIGRHGVPTHDFFTSGKLHLELKRGGAIKICRKQTPSMVSSFKHNIYSRGFFYSIVHVSAPQIGDLCPAVDKCFSIGSRTLCTFKIR